MKNYVSHAPACNENRYLCKLIKQLIQLWDNWLF